jgi:hypothetical protein
MKSSVTNVVSVLFILFHVDLNLASSAPVLLFYMIGAMHIYVGPCKYDDMTQRYVLCSEKTTSEYLLISCIGTPYMRRAIYRLFIYGHFKTGT